MTVLHHVNKSVPRPAPFSSITPITSSNPTANYSDVLNMALKYNNWTLAFSELQMAFDLPLVQIHDSIVNDFKPEYTCNTINISPPLAEETSFVNPATPELSTSMTQKPTDQCF